METIKKKALVVGATGLVGSHLLDILNNDEAYDRVYALTRKEQKDYGKIKWLSGSKGELPDLPEGESIDEFYCALGTTIKQAGSKENFYAIDHDYVLECANWALGSGIKLAAVVSSLGADPSSWTFYLKVKGEVEEDLKQLGFKSLVILRPSLLLGERKESRFGEKVGEFMLKLFSPLLFGPLKKQRPVHAKQVAKQMVSSLNEIKSDFSLVDSNLIREQKL